MGRIARWMLAMALAAGGPAVSLAGGAPAARAQDRDGARKGLAVARHWCARCHVVAAGQTGPVLDAAPPFADIANDPRMTPSRLRGILVNPHGRMPTEPLTRDDIADLIAYIESLKREQP